MINNLSFRDYFFCLLDIFLPRHCLVCGDKLGLREKHVCLHCLADMPRTFYSDMPRNWMADRFNALVQRDLDNLAEHPEGKVPYSYATALFFYRASTGYRNITRSLKYHGNLAAGKFFAGVLAKEMVDSDLFRDIVTVIPVPLHWSRLWSRGYNQAEVIGAELARVLNARQRTDILARRRRTRTQTKLSIEKKTANVSGAFTLVRGASLEGCCHILIVDDVFTTGATVHACYEVLREIAPPPVKISVATLACVGE